MRPGPRRATYGDFIYSPGVTTTTFEATDAHHRVTYVTMIAPSPDWFAGTQSLPLLVNGRWRDGLTNLREAELGSDPTKDDSDNDTILDDVDNCILIFNSSQSDADSDTVGDSCDNCPSHPNLSQSDADGDSEADLGSASDGTPRPNTNGCPTP